MKKIDFSSPLLQSRIQTEDTRKSEQWLGYFLGPCLVHMIYTGIAGTYLMQFYTDVLGLAGVILTMMPLIAKALSGVIGFFIGRIIDKTRTVQGKARPWILLSGPMLALCGFLLYAVPRASYSLQIAWVMVSYNLFFSLAFSVYSLSHAMMVPLSTRNTKQRDSLAMLSSMAISMLPGALTTVAMPLLVRQIGVGDAARGSWLTVMGILSVFAIPATLIEYFFRKSGLPRSWQIPPWIHPSPGRYTPASTIDTGCWSWRLRCCCISAIPRVQAPCFITAIGFWAIPWNPGPPNSLW